MAGEPWFETGLFAANEMGIGFDTEGGFMNRFIVFQSPGTPFWSIVRAGNGGGPTGQKIAGQIPTQALAQKLANALELQEFADEKYQRKVKSLADLILLANAEQNRIIDGE